MKRKILLLLAIIALLCQMAEARQPRRGYRGFIEWSNSVNRQKFASGATPEGEILGAHDKTVLYGGFSTSHGYQINPKFFVGAGLDIEACTYHNDWISALFLQGRIDMKLGKFTPYGDVRVGAHFMSGVGAYFSPTVGYRFNWGRKMGVNAGLGMSLVDHKYLLYDLYDCTEGMLLSMIEKRCLRPYFSFRVGIDF